MLKAQLLEIISNGEGFGIEFKSDDIRPRQLITEAMAIANLRGSIALQEVVMEKEICALVQISMQCLCSHLG